MLNSPLWGLSCFPFPPRCERVCCHPLNLCQSDRWECQYRISTVLTCAFFFLNCSKSWTSLHMFICLCPFLLCVCVNYWVGQKVWVFPKILWRKPEKTFWPIMLCFALFTLIYIIRRANQYICSIEPSYLEKIKFIFDVHFHDFQE